MKKSLFALALGGFGIGMTEFSIMGLLPNIAGHLHISIPQAGYIISAYALGVVVGAPILTSIGGKLSPKTLLIILMTMFTIFNGLTAIAPNFFWMMVTRFLAGLPHGAFFGIGSVVASRMAGKGKEAQAVSSMFAGLTLANVIGVPAATFVGYHYGYPIAFALVSLCGLLTALSIEVFIPKLEANPNASFRNDLKIFKHFNLWIAILITSIGFGGFFAWISYIAPLLMTQAGYSSDAIPLLMMVAGVGMTVGIIWGGKLADRYSALITTISLMFAVMVVLMLNGIFAASHVLIVPLTFLTGLLAMAQCPAIQLLLIQNSGEAEMLGAALGQSSFNIGNSLGAFFGGIPLAMGLSYASPQWTGATMSFVGAMLGIYLLSRMKSTKLSIPKQIA